jgi:hypothetical protein
MIKTTTARAAMLGAATACLLFGAGAGLATPPQDQATDGTLPGGAGHGSLIEDSGAAQRVDAAARLRTLTQRVAAAACRTHHGYDRDDAVEAMDTAGIDFHDAISLLIYGAPELGVMGGETHPRLLRSLQAVEAAWEPILWASVDLGEAPETADALETIRDGTEALLDVTAQVSAAVEADYANPVEMLSADALLIGLAGRQAMQAQRLSALACTLLADPRDAAAAAEATAVVAYLDAGLAALRDGDAALGLPAAPTPEIAQLLDGTIAIWGNLNAALERVRAGEPLDGDARAEMFDALDAVSDAMALLTTLYGEHSKRVM